MDFLGGVEVDAVDEVHHVAQQVAAFHAVDDAGKDGGDHVAAVVAVGPLESLEVGEQAGAFGAAGANGLFVVDEGEQFGAGNAVARAAQSCQR